MYKSKIYVHWIFLFILYIKSKRKSTWRSKNDVLSVTVVGFRNIRREENYEKSKRSHAR